MNSKKISNSDLLAEVLKNYHHQNGDTAYTLLKNDIVSNPSIAWEKISTFIDDYMQGIVHELAADELEKLLGDKQ